MLPYKKPHPHVCHLTLSLLFFLLAAIAIPSTALSLDIVIDDPGPGITVNKVKNANSESTYPLASAEDIVCGKSHHMVRFRLNNKHAGLPFSISAKKMTRVKLRWDYPDKIYFPFPDIKKTIVFPHSGGESRMYFRAYQPISGNIYVINDNNAVIKTCPYSFLAAKRFRQSISVNVNETQYENINNDQNHASIDYRISSKSVVPEGGYWSLRLGVSKSESSTDSHRVSSGFSYNW